VASGARAAVLFALSARSKTGGDGLRKLKAVSRLSASLDSAALQHYVDHLMAAFPSGRLTLAGEPSPPAFKHMHSLHALTICMDNLQP
jgi:hypothetical protein